MVVLVVFLREVNPLHLRRSPPPPQRLVSVQHGDVAEVGHPSHRLEEVKPTYGLIVKECVE